MHRIIITIQLHKSKIGSDTPKQSKSQSIYALYKQSIIQCVRNAPVNNSFTIALQFELKSLQLYSSQTIRFKNVFRIGICISRKFMQDNIISSQFIKDTKLLCFNRSWVKLSDFINRQTNSIEILKSKWKPYKIAKIVKRSESSLYKYIINESMRNTRFMKVHIQPKVS